MFVDLTSVITLVDLTSVITLVDLTSVITFMFLQVCFVAKLKLRFLGMNLACLFCNRRRGFLGFGFTLSLSVIASGLGGVWCHNVKVNDGQENKKADDVGQVETERYAKFDRTLEAGRCYIV
jgi:hypothetical protein